MLTCRVFLVLYRMPVIVKVLIYDLVVWKPCSKSLWGARAKALSDLSPAITNLQPTRPREIERPAVGRLFILDPRQSSWRHVRDNQEEFLSIRDIRATIAGSRAVAPYGRRSIKVKEDIERAGL